MRGGGGEHNHIDITSYEFKEWTKNLWYFDKDNKQGFESILCASNNAKKGIHPAPYPEDLIERLLKIYSYKNDIVLDPFNGTGTTTAVAYKLNRQFIGIELSKQYCYLALQRLQSNKNDKFIYIKTFDKNTAKLVNNDDIRESLNTFFPYKEAFSPYLIDFLSQRFDCKVDSIFDPFCGVGSSFLSSYTTKCFGFDTNPLAINITIAKLKPLKQESINKAIKLLKTLTLESTSIFDLPQWKSFNKYADKKRFSIIMNFIQAFEKLDSEVYHFIKYVVISNLDKMLDYKKDGNGIKFRQSKIDDITLCLKELLIKALKSKKQFDLQHNKTLSIYNQSSVFGNFDFKVDCVLTSPPYANLFDYFEVYKMELWSSGLIKRYTEWRTLKKSALRNNKNTNLDVNDFINNQILQTTLKNLKNNELEFNTLTMLKNYFYDLQLVLHKCYKTLKSQGFCFIVVGNSCYKGIPIVTDEILANEAQKIGFKFIDLIIARKLNTSSQQMKIIDNKSKLALRESIIVLQKD
ncbi:DNA-methyltransferase [Helicobacter sp. 23-1048]